MRLDRRIAVLADRSHGIIENSELRAIGATRGQIGNRLERRRLIRLHRGVYAAGHRRLLPEGWWLAAVRAIGPGAVLSHHHAAALWELRPARGGRVHVTVVSRGRRQRQGIAVHSVPDLPHAHVTKHRGIPVTTVARTLADLAGAVAGAQLARAVEAAEAQRLLDVPSTLEASAGRTGARALRRLLQTEAVCTRSDLEAAFLELCDAHAIPRPAVNARLGGYEVDALWPAPRLVVELDGFRHHGTRAAFERDRARDATLVAHGFRVLRFTYRQVTDAPAAVAVRVSAALAGGSGAA